MLNILVTGATGNVGKELVRLLTDEDCHIYAAVRNFEQAKKTLGDSSKISYVE